MRHSRRIESVDRVGDTLGAAIGHMIACERDGADAGAGYRRQVARRGAGRRDVALHLSLAVGMRHLEMADRQIGHAKHCGDSIQPVIGIGFVEDKIPGYDDFTSCPRHVSTRAAPRCQILVRRLTANSRPMGLVTVGS